MKRRYKTGDWFRVPLHGPHDAVGIVTRACRSRLFGYFFAVPAQQKCTPHDLRAFRPESAAHRALFGGKGLEDARWELVATSLPFDRDAWPFPRFAARGAFGRTWSLCEYDPLEMRITSTQDASESSLGGLPDARFATPLELEAALRAAIAGDPSQAPLVICEIASPVDPPALAPLSRGGRVQCSSPLDARDRERLAAFLSEHRNVELRLHGTAASDAQLLRALPFLESLVLDGARAGLLANGSLPHVRRLELRGPRADLAILDRFPHLRELVLVNTPPVHLRALSCRESLRSLCLRHVRVESADFAALPALESLELVALPSFEALPAFEVNASLRTLRLRALENVRDLSPLARAPQLRSLTIERMPHLNVDDFRVLREARQLRLESVDVGSRRKEREIYRMLAREE